MESIFSGYWWLWFNLCLITLLIVDVNFLRKQQSRSCAIMLTVAWIMLTLLFALLLQATKGADVALTFLTGYVIEKSLSIDNLFVFYIIFEAFNVPKLAESRILMYGILGALLLRLVLIFVGISLINLAHVLLIVFGACLLVTGIALFKKPRKKMTPKPPWLAKFLPITRQWHADQFFIRKGSAIMATPAFVVLLSIETTDLLFALDSVPAVFAVTLDPFLVYSCNALAIVGLRSIFFVIKEAIAQFSFMHYAVCLILVFVGAKMIVSPVFSISTASSLGIIAAIILSCFAYSKAKR